MTTNLRTRPVVSDSKVQFPQRLKNVQSPSRRSVLDKSELRPIQKMNLNKFNEFSSSRIESLKSKQKSSSSSCLSNLRIQMLTQARKARNFTASFAQKFGRVPTQLKLNESKSKQNSKNVSKLKNNSKVVDSLTQLIESKSEIDNNKNSLVFKVLEKKIKNYLIKSGKCSDKKKLDEAAKKMAAFVSDIMRETYKNRKLKKKADNKGSKGDEKSNNNNKVNRSNTSLKSIGKTRSSSSRISIRSTLETIPEENIKAKKIVRSVSSEARLRSKPKLPFKTLTRSRTSINELKSSQLSKNTKILKPSSKKSIATVKKPSSAESITIKNEKDKINSWLDEVSERTKKWTDWIGQTISKAEQSKKRIQRGENIKEVSGDWTNFLKIKKQQSDSFGSPSDIWKPTNDTEIQKHNQHSIQQWLARNNTNRIGSREHLSCLSFKTNSVDSSMYSVWSSREPSSIYAGESELTKLRQLGVIPK